MSLPHNGRNSLSPKEMKRLSQQLAAARHMAESSMFGESPSLSDVTAHHEASHAVLAVKLGIPFEYVFISMYEQIARPGDIVGGLHLTPEIARLLTSDAANLDDRRKLEQLAVVAIAGEAGQAVLEQRPCNMRLASAEGDYEIVVKLASKLYPDPADSVAFIERQIRIACELVAEPLCNRQIECVANQLHTPLELSYASVVEWMEVAAAGFAETRDNEAYDSETDD